MKRYLSLGYTVARGLVSEREIETLFADTAKILKGGYGGKHISPLHTGATQDEVQRSFLCLHNPHALSPVIARTLRHPLISCWVNALAGAHLWDWKGGVKCMQSMLFSKPPGFPGQAWHQDEAYIPTRDRSLLGAWIALDPTTRENGCLWVLPGSHRPGVIYPMGKPDSDEFDGSPESFGFDPSGEIPVAMERGDVLFFNGYILHRSLKNKSQTYRRALVNHYMSASSLLPWKDAAKNTPVARADYRGIVHVAGVDPYPWKKTHVEDCAFFRPTAV